MQAAGGKTSKSPRRKMRRPEQALQALLIRDLSRILTDETFFFAVPNGGYRSGIEAAIFAGQGVVAGVPDLIFISRGRAYGLELKAARGRLTDRQIQVHSRLRTAGMEIGVVRSLDEAIDFLRTNDIPLRIAA